MCCWGVKLCGSVKSTDVSKENIASIFKIHQKAKQEIGALLPAYFMLLSSVVSSSTLKMEVTCSSET
jgi:hypothetical protein